MGGEGSGAKAKKTSQEIINKKNIFLRIMAKNFHLTCPEKKILHLL